MNDRLLSKIRVWLAETAAARTRSQRSRYFGLHWAAAALVGAVSVVPVAPAVQAQGLSTSTVRLGSGRSVEYAIPFDRNALENSNRVDNSLIALTSSGALLRFELPAMRLDREHIEPENAIECLGRGEGDVILAGSSDGRVSRINPETLELTEVVTLTVVPRWIGWSRAAGNRPAGLLVVTRPTRSVERPGIQPNQSKSMVHDLATGKTFTLEQEATTFLADSAGRLWLGVDKGEWGGRITRVDLAAGTMTVIKPPASRDPAEEALWDGVYGLIELRDRQVLAFGGTSHMGLNSGFITRIDEAAPRTLFQFESHPATEKEPDSSRPAMPITHVIEENDGLLVFAYSDVFRVDKQLKSWKKTATLPIQYVWGRRDAVGAYPSVRAIHPPLRDGEPYILATRVDGFVSLYGLKTTLHTLPGQLSAGSIDRIQNTVEGTLFFKDGDVELDDVPVTWMLGPKGWEITSLGPPAEIAQPKKAETKKDEDADEDSEAPNHTCVLVDPASGEIYTATGSGERNGTLTTARRLGGKTVLLGREVSSLEPASCFITPGGTLWNASNETLMRFENGRWKTEAQLPDAKGGHRLSLMGKDGPPWHLLDRSDHTIWRFDLDANAKNPRLNRIEIREGDRLLQTTDAIPQPGGALLLATDAGLRVFDPVRNQLTKVDFPEPPQPALALVRDGLGRLWLGCENGLWMAEHAAKSLQKLDRAPSILRKKVYALAPDPHHADGVVVALGPNGVAFVRAPRTG